MATDTKPRMAGDALEEDTPVAAIAKETVATGEAPDEAKGLDAYIDYLNNYDRKARGAGSSRGTDRFSGLDVRHVFDARDEYGISDQDAADQVIKYSDRIKGESKMGGATQDALDKLRGMLGEEEGPKGFTEEPITIPDVEMPDIPVYGDEQEEPKPSFDFSSIIRQPGETPAFAVPGLVGGINNNQTITTEANITGDGNSVNQQIDASVGSRYGGGGSFKDSWMKDYFA